MLLVVDLSDLELQVGSADIALIDDSDMSIGQLIGKLCEGIEAYAKEMLPDYSQLYLQTAFGVRMDPTDRVRDLRLDDWDTVYLKRRRR